MADLKHQSKFYDIFLNMTFCVPSFDREKFDGESAGGEGQVFTLIIESEGDDWLMLFDAE